MMSMMESTGRHYSRHAPHWDVRMRQGHREKRGGVYKKELERNFQLFIYIYTIFEMKNSSDK